MNAYSYAERGKLRRWVNTLKALESIQKTTKAVFYIAGGAVRDLLVGRDPTDLDVVATKIGVTELWNKLRGIGEVRALNFSSTRFGITLFRVDDEPFTEIALPRTEISTGTGHRDFEIAVGPEISLKEDSDRRDFKINALYLPLSSRDRSDIIDYQEGLEDIKRRKISFVGNPKDRIYEDPLRMLRAISLQARTGYRIGSVSFDSISKLSRLIKEIPAERINVELRKVLLARKPSTSFILLHKTGLLRYIMPELEECVGVNQDRTYHKYDVFTHCIKSCDNAPPSLVLRLAALLHDIGKPDTKGWNESKGKITFYNHEVVGELKARKALGHLKFSNKEIEDVCFLVAMHMYDFRARWTDKAVRRFVKRVGITSSDLANLGNIPLFQLRIADRLGSGFKNIRITKRQKALEQRIIGVFEKAGVFDIKDLVVNGDDVIENCGIRESPDVGIILETVFNIVLDKPFLNNRDDLLHMVMNVAKQLDTLKTAKLKHHSVHDYKRAMVRKILEVNYNGNSLST